MCGRHLPKLSRVPQIKIVPGQAHICSTRHPFWLPIYLTINLLKFELFRKQITFSTVYNMSTSAAEIQTPVVVEEPEATAQKENKAETMPKAVEEAVPETEVCSLWRAC